MKTHSEHNIVFSTVMTHVITLWLHIIPPSCRCKTVVVNFWEKSYLIQYKSKCIDNKIIVYTRTSCFIVNVNIFLTDYRQKLHNTYHGVNTKYKWAILLRYINNFYRLHFTNGLDHDTGNPGIKKLKTYYIKKYFTRIIICFRIIRVQYLNNVLFLHWVVNTNYFVIKIQFILQNVVKVNMRIFTYIHIIRFVILCMLTFCSKTYYKIVFKCHSQFIRKTVIMIRIAFQTSSYRSYFFWCFLIQNTRTYMLNKSFIN